MVNKVKDADDIIFVGGLSSSLEGEEMEVDYPGFRRGDRVSIDLPRVQTEMMKELKKTGKPLVFVMCAGSAVAIPWEAENCDAILDAFYPGEEGGTAVGEVLAGDYNPAGRLPVTFYASADDLPDFEDYSMQGRTYRFFEGTPLYPFGHGLSYTTFKYGKAKLNKSKIKAGQDVEITIPLTNSGKMDGDEVVQVYVQNLDDPDGPLKSLKAFKRVPVKAGEKVEVKLDIPALAFEIYNRKAGAMKVMPGRYRILYGGSSDNAKLSGLPLTIL